MSKESDELLWLALKSELGGDKAMKFINDLKMVGIDLNENTEWCVNNRQTIYTAIVAWQFGLLDALTDIKLNTKKEEE